MDISADKKVDVLIAIFESRLSQVKQIRNRSVSFLLWICAIFIFVAGHLMSQKLVIDLQQKIGITLILSVAVSMMALQLKILHRGFHNHLEILVKVEEVLGLYSAGVYDESPLFPDRWKQPAETSEFFRFIYMAIGLLTILLCSLIWAGDFWV